MKGVFSRSTIEARLQAAFGDTVLLKSSIADPEPPQDIATWLGDLALLNGVPFNYLVPDEGMLPPESIRFFYLDSNWVAALLDGASSIGRNLTNDPSGTTVNPSFKIDQAVRPDVLAQVAQKRVQARPKLFGMEAPLLKTVAGVPPIMQTISGFVLRSSLVLEYQDIGVDAYPVGHTPDDPSPQSLEIVRMERLGDNSDTILCLVQGDAYRIDVHEAPQVLHYGIDCYNSQCQVGGNPATAVKNVHTFGITTAVNGDGVTTQSVTMTANATPVDISASMRGTSRVISLSTLAQTILQANTAATPPPGTQKPTVIDSAAMGFEMTVGVGMVSFYKTN